MRKILPFFIIILLLSINYALAEKNEIIQIKLGTSYNKITSMKLQLVPSGAIKKPFIN